MVLLYSSAGIAPRTGLFMEIDGGMLTLEARLRRSMRRLDRVVVE